MVGLLLAVLGIFVIILVGSLQIDDSAMRRMFVGFLSCASLISMFASPLFIIKLVIRTKSIEFMPFYLSLSTFLMSFSFFLYGLLSDDAFIYVPNGIGTVLGIIQLVLYFYYKGSSSEECREPLIVSYEWSVLCCWMMAKWRYNQMHNMWSRFMVFTSVWGGSLKLVSGHSSCMK